MKQKTRTKALSWLLSLALMLSLLPGMSMTALADDEWTEVGTADALQTAVNENKTNIKLTADIDVSGLDGDYGDLDVSGQTLTLDLNGHTLSNSKDNGVIWMNSGNITIEDGSDNKTGAITSSSYYGIMHKGGTLNITGGTVTGSFASIDSMAGTLNVSGGNVAGNNFGVYAEGTTTVNITGGKINAKTTGVIAPSEEGDSPTIKVSGGYITDGNYGIITQSGTVEVSNNGFVYGKERGISAENRVSAVTITGGAVGGGKGGLVVAKSASPSVTISNGLLWHHSEVSEIGYALELSNAGGEGVISGGNFRGTVRVDAEGGDPLNNVKITGGCFEKNFNTANNSKPTIEGGEFWGRITTANSGPIIKGGVYAHEPVEDGKTFIADGHSIVGLKGATYQEGTVSGTYNYGVVATPTMSVTPESATKTYDGTGITLTAEPSALTVTTKGATEQKTYDISWSYQWTKGEDTQSLGTEASYTTGANVSDPWTYKCTLKSGDNVVAVGTKVVTITKRTASVTAKNQSIYVGQNIPEWNAESYTVDGLVGEDTVTVSVEYWQNDAKVAEPDKNKAGTYTIKPKVTPSNNYAVTPINGTLTISNYPAPSAPTTYAPIISATENGSVALEPKAAEAGKPVTVKVAPDEGYKLGELTVKDASGKEVELKKNDDGTYTFTQPSGKVTIEAKFIAIFSDIAEDSYYADAVDWAVMNGITNGVDDTHFAPDATCTRAQAVTFLWRALGCPEPKATKSEFTDVAENAFYFKAVLWATENGVTLGYDDGRFGVDEVVTRAHMVTFMERAMKGKATTAESFTDVPEGAFYADAAAWAKENGISDGIGDNKFGGETDCLRAQIVTMLYRYFVK